MFHAKTGTVAAQQPAIFSVLAGLLLPGVLASARAGGAVTAAGGAPPSRH